MIKANSTTLVNCYTEEAFKYVANGFFENHPKWEPAVVHLEKTSEGPIGIGTSGRQVRNDGGRKSESTFRITEFEPNHKFSVASTGRPDFKATYSIEQVDRGTQLTFAFNLVGHAWLCQTLRAADGWNGQKGKQAIVDNLKRLLETEKQFI